MSETERVMKWLIEEMKFRGETVSVAESCTGGGLARLMTGVSGASSIFVGGVIAYAPRIKESHLGVDERLTSEEAIVSCATAQAMASGVCRRLGSTWGVGTTGYAGPGGGCERYGVGTVCIGIFSQKYGVYASWACHFEGARESVMSQGAASALRFLEREVKRVYGKADE